MGFLGHYTSTISRSVHLKCFYLHILLRYSDFTVLICLVLYQLYVLCGGLWHKLQWLRSQLELKWVIIMTHKTWGGTTPEKHLCLDSQSSTLSTVHSGCYQSDKSLVLHNDTTRPYLIKWQRLHRQNSLSYIQFFSILLFYLFIYSKLNKLRPGLYF